MDNLDFPQIYAAFQPKILRYLIRLVGEAEAEDLTQEVFVKVNRALKDFRGESSLSTWIYRIATHTALDRLRSPADQHPLPLHDENTLEESGEKKELSIEQQLVRKQMNDCIRRFVDRLPEHYRTVLVLGELEGLKNKEIADILGISLNTVKIRLHRARTKLREELKNHCEAYWIEDNEFVPDLRHAFEN